MTYWQLYVQHILNMDDHTSILALWFSVKSSMRFPGLLVNLYQHAGKTF